jgi:hypothetical protein
VEVEKDVLPLPLDDEEYEDNAMYLFGAIGFLISHVTCEALYQPEVVQCAFKVVMFTLVGALFGKCISV